MQALEAVSQFEIRRKRKTNPRIDKLIEDLKRIARENSAPIWRDIAKQLEKR